MLSTDTQPFILTKYLIKESEKNQKPSLYVIDIAKIADDTNSFTGEETRKTLDSLKFSKNRINAINAVLKDRNDIENKEYLNYYFSFLMYHNLWKEGAILSNIKDKQILYKGYFFNDYTTQIKPQEKYNWIGEKEDLNEKSKKILMDLIEYIKLCNLNVLFIVPVRTYDTATNKKINDAIEIIKDNQFEVINFNTEPKLDNIDFSTDLHDSKHLNVYGATKYTLYFAKYLEENYNLNDHRNDKKYKSWAKEYERFKTDFKEITKTEFEELL